MVTVLMGCLTFNFKNGVLVELTVLISLLFTVESLL